MQGGNQTLEKNQKNSKFQLGWREPLVAIFDQLSCCQPSLMSAITRNIKNGLYEKMETYNESLTHLSRGQSLF